MTTDETTPLLNGNANGHDAQASKPAARNLLAWFRPSHRVLVSAFIVALAFTITQVPILYAFRKMECEHYYEQHAPYEGDGDRCDRNEISAATAIQISIIGMTTAFSGMINLFVAGWQIKRWGPRAALLIQTFFPALRVASQALAVAIGSRTGIIIMQSTQAIGVIGGPAGCILVSNTAIAEVVEPAARTIAFGLLQGSFMLGTSVGYLLGGVIGDGFGIGRPFEVSFCIFMFTVLYDVIFVPYIDPKSLSDGQDTKKGGLGAFFGQLTVLTPQKIRLDDGRVVRHFGVLFLALGVFLGVVATGFAPVLIQLYATAAFDFGPADNGYLMSGNSLIRGFFLIAIFPVIISSGRKWFARSRGGERPGADAEAQPPRQGESIATHPEDLDPIQGILAQEEPPKPLEPATEQTGSGFDLFFLRWSLVVDGAVTACIAFATTGWHIYLAGYLLPLASGSAAASKGVITEMCPASKRTDALQAITLVESVAALTTLGFFGFVFSAFTEAGKAYLTFYCNAALALVAVGVLCLSSFPPAGSQLVEEAHGAVEEVDAAGTEN